MRSLWWYILLRLCNICGAPEAQQICIGNIILLNLTYKSGLVKALIRIIHHFHCRGEVWTSFLFKYIFKYLLQLGSAHIDLGNMNKAREHTLEALQQYYNDASDELLYDYHGDFIPYMTRFSAAKVKPDLINC